jgi:hypothetical protein
VNDSRKSPWLSGLLAAIFVAVVLIAVAANGVMTLLSSLTPQ